MMLWLRKRIAAAIAAADLSQQRLFAVSLLFILMSNCCQSHDPKSTIVKDIQSALSIITNDTNLLNNIMHKMYKPALMQPSEPIVVFQLPNEGKTATASTATTSTIEMTRSDFAAPTFPNITRNEMLERIKRLPTSTNTAQQWQLLGLSGWAGELSQKQRNTQLKEISTESDSLDAYPIKEILKDLYDGTEMKSPTDVDTAKAIEISSNVYIARVNDPFGYSTKWAMRNSSEHRNKRDIVELYSMIKCATGCDPLVYKGYGCYCGFSGGGVPVDSIDYCCQIHDKCYEQAGNCISYLEYFVPYVWKCYFGKPLCALDHGEWGGPLSCAARLCYCDVQLSFCLRKFICPWNRATCPTRFARFLNLIT